MTVQINGTAIIYILNILSTSQQKIIKINCSTKNQFYYTKDCRAEQDFKGESSQEILTEL